MMVQGQIKAALVALSMVGLASCGGGQTVTPEMFDAEVQRLSDSGDMYGEVFMALKTRRPELYKDFRRIAQREFRNGRNVRDASQLASLAMRDKFLDEMLLLSRTASDETVDEVIDVILDTYTILGEKNPDDCARNVEGLPPEKVTDLPRELRQRETALVIKMLNAPPTAANRRAASRKEVVNWMFNLSKVEPSVGPMLQMLDNEGRGKKSNQIICDGMIATYKRLSYKKSSERGVLFRGLALMALQERLHVRNTTDPDKETS